MFGNFLEETATGTGATLALAGVTTGNIAFQEKFSDGDLVAYVVDDSGGTIKVGGIGAYVSATDDITRSDTWSWNGTTYDDNPSTNITLSGGTHTVRCDALSKDLNVGFGGISPSGATSGVEGDGYVGNTRQNSTAGALMNFSPLLFVARRYINEISYRVMTADAGDTDTRCGIYSVGIDGKPDRVLVDSGILAATTTGEKTATLASPIELPAGLYFQVVATLSATAILGGLSRDNCAVKSLGGDSFSYRAGMFTKTFSGGALPANVTGLSASTNVHPIIRTYE